MAHSGGLPGFGSNWVMMPDHGIAVFAFDNRTYAGTSAVTLAVLDSLVSGAGLDARALSPSPVLANRIERPVAYLPSWEGAEADTALFADSFFMDERVGGLRDRFTELFAEAGSITEIGELRPWNRLRGIVRLHGTLRDVEVAFTLSPGDGAPDPAGAGPAGPRGEVTRRRRPDATRPGRSSGGNVGLPGLLDDLVQQIEKLGTRTRIRRQAANGGQVDLLRRNAEHRGDVA